MPLYVAMIQVRLDEPDLEKAKETAESLAIQICNESVTDCATVALVAPYLEVEEISEDAPF